MGWGLASVAQNGPDFRISLEQLHWEGDRLDFDVALQVNSAEKRYLAFTDVVLRFDLSSMSDTATCWFWPGSSQLLNAEGARNVFYEQGLVIRLERRAEEVLVYIGLEPPKFKGLAEFVYMAAELDNRPGFYRLGRFSVTGLQQLPDEIDVYTANKGIRSQAFEFLPKQDFKAVPLPIDWGSGKILEQPLEWFEAQKQGEKVEVSFFPGEGQRWKSISLERSYDLVQWEEAWFVPVKTTKVIDAPQPPSLLEGRPMVYYRLRIEPVKGKVFFSPIRLVEF